MVEAWSVLGDQAKVTSCNAERTPEIFEHADIAIRAPPCEGVLVHVNSYMQRWGHVISFLSDRSAIFILVSKSILPAEVLNISKRHWLLACCPYI